MEIVVFVASLKFFFVEGGEQLIVGIQEGGDKSNGQDNYCRNIFCNYIVFLIILLACVNFD